MLYYTYIHFLFYHENVQVPRKVKSILQWTLLYPPPGFYQQISTTIILSRIYTPFYPSFGMHFKVSC